VIHQIDKTGDLDEATQEKLNKANAEYKNQK